MMQNSLLVDLRNALEVKAMPCPFTDKPPEGLKTFTVPTELHGVASMWQARRLIATKIKNLPDPRDTWAWSKANSLAEVPKKILEDSLAKQHDDSGRTFVFEYWTNWQYSCK